MPDPQLTNPDPKHCLSVAAVFPTTIIPSQKYPLIQCPVHTVDRIVNYVLILCVGRIARATTVTPPPTTVRHTLSPPFRSAGMGGQPFPAFSAVFRICDILMQIRILGSVTLTDVSGSCSFRPSSLTR
jgi:hypothetical protein